MSYDVLYIMRWFILMLDDSYALVVYMSYDVIYNMRWFIHMLDWYLNVISWHVMCVYYVYIFVCMCTLDVLNDHEIRGWKVYFDAKDMWCVNECV